MKQADLILILTLSIFAPVAKSFAYEPQKELQRYQSCWKKFVGTYFDATTAPYISEINNGEMSAIEACMDLLKRADLTQQTGNSNGLAINHNSTSKRPTDEIGYNVLKNFYQIHASFLSSGNNPTNQTNQTYGTIDWFVYDEGGGGHSSYFTKHLFTSQDLDSSELPSYPFFKTFNDKKTLRPIRWSRAGIEEVSLVGNRSPTNTTNTGTLCVDDCEVVFNTYVIVDPETVFTPGNVTRNDGRGEYFRDHSKREDIFGDKKSYNMERGGMRNHTGSFTIPGQIEVQTFTIPLSSAKTFGGLIGFEEQKEVISPGLHLLPTTGGRADGYQRNFLNLRELNQDYDLSQNIFFNPGLGALTEPNYQARRMSFNDGISSQAPQDGANRVPRKWAESFFNEVLCRELPVIRVSDAIKYIDVNATNDETPFRLGSTCMSCHASMDNLAYITRNYKLTKSSYFGATKSDLTKLKSSIDLSERPKWELYIGSFLKPFLPSEITNPELVEKHKDLIARPYEDALFPYRLADGDFRFRDMYGKLHDIRLESTFDNQYQSFEELGNVLKELDDTYACFASKYIDALTGVKIHLFDPGDANAPKLSSRDQKLLNWLQNLAKDFKKHQSAKRLIREIVASDLFLDNKGAVPTKLYGDTHE